MHNRVLVWGSPGLLHEIVADALIDEPGLVVIDTTDAQHDLRAALAANAPDVIVAIDPRDAEGRECTRFVDESANRAALAIHDDGRTLVLTRLELERLRIDEASIDGVVRAVREVSARAVPLEPLAASGVGEAEHERGDDEWRVLELGVRATKEQLSVLLRKLQCRGLVEQCRLPGGRTIYRASTAGIAALARTIQA